jgi:hypothetical protein
MSKTNKKQQQADQVEQDTVEAVESQDQTTVDTVTEVEQAAGGYVVQWAIKLDGKRYGIGDSVDMTAEQAAPFLASGAVTAKG